METMSSADDDSPLSQDDDVHSWHTDTHTHTQLWVWVRQMETMSSTDDDSPLSQDDDVHSWHTDIHTHTQLWVWVRQMETMSSTDDDSPLSQDDDVHSWHTDIHTDTHSYECESDRWRQCPVLTMTVHSHRTTMSTHDTLTYIHTAMSVSQTDGDNVQYWWWQSTLTGRRCPLM